MAGAALLIVLLLKDALAYDLIGAELWADIMEFLEEVSSSLAKRLPILLPDGSLCSITF